VTIAISTGLTVYVNPSRCTVNGFYVHPRATIYNLEEQSYLFSKKCIIVYVKLSDGSRGRGEDSGHSE